MKIVIVGAGKVGYSLAQRLIQDDHDVYVIDRSPERIHNLENTLDVSLVLGNGSDVQLLNEIDMSDVGMFIAVTDSDEVNMLSCSVAKIKGVPTTIARVRDNSVAEHMDEEIRAQLGVDLFINPEYYTGFAVNYRSESGRGRCCMGDSDRTGRLRFLLSGCYLEEISDSACSERGMAAG